MDAFYASAPVRTADFKLVRQIIQSANSKLQLFRNVQMSWV